jgi:amino acid adenylation domain-containing protein
VPPLSGMPRQDRALSAVIAGDAAVTLRCAEILLAGGHLLLGLITGDDRVAAWAAGRGVSCRFEPPDRPLTRAAVEELTGGRPFDLLFSIHNLRILPPEVLALPARMAVNYHDALLPRYAGLHATSWAIFHGERVHGITWHLMTGAVDAGEILLQRRLPLEPDDTAWTLNARCAEAAVESFPELLAELATGRAAPRAQRAGERTWFPGWRRPAPGCAIPWESPAETVSAFVRALDFGAADNPLGIPKLLAPGGPLLVAGVEVEDRESGEPAGTVLAVEPEGVAIATATRDVRVRLAEGQDASALIPGLRLPPAAPQPERLEEWERSLKRQEGYWAGILAELAPLAPATTPSAQGGHAGPLPRERSVDEALAAVLAWLRLEIGEPFHVALGEPELRRELVQAGWTGLFALRPPLRVELSGAMTLRSFREELRRLREERRRRGTYAADLPARLRRLRSRPLQEPAVAVDLLAEGEDPRELPPGPATALSIAISPDGRLTWSGPLRGLASRFTSWLETADPDRPLRPAEGSATLFDLFREQVARDPGAVALEAGEERWSYGDLARRAGGLAAALRRRGVGPERLVALRLERLPDLVTAILAVLEAGGAFLVLDPLDPPGRQARILEEARPWLALADPGLHRLAPGLPVLPMALAGAREGPGPGSEAATAGALAYVAFTSGSTGTPKGVAVEHRSIVHYVQAAGRRFGLGPGDRLPWIGSPAFDLAYEQIFGALCHGATLIGLKGPGLPASRDLLGACERLGITVLDLPTAVWDRLARDAGEQALAMPPALRLVVIGGDAARAESARLWLGAAAGGPRLLNTYGPTEATIVATWWDAPADPGQLPMGEILPIGRPVEGVAARVLDEDLRPVAPGEAGELWLGGAGLARGYHRRPDLTAERFLTLEGARLYRTGDRVRLAPDGDLEYLGRLDRQVKIAGRRVEPGEVEAVLREIPGVVDAVVAPAGGGDSLRLVAWVVLQDPAALSAVRQEAARRLPAPLRPARLAAAAALPRSPSGKVDLSALQEASPVSDGPPDPVLRDEVDAALASLWESILESGAVSPGDDFFDLGGDSLSALALLAGIEKTFGRRVPVARLLRASTFAALAGEIRRLGAEETPPLLVPLQPLGDAPPLVCVHGLGGHLLRLLPLARALAPGRLFFGLQSPGLDGEEPIPETVEELAATFLAEVRRHWGPGPYLLCGMSFGGLVAFEMARQAAASGGPPGLVALFDTDLNEALPGMRSAEPSGLELLSGRLRRLLGDRLGRSRRLVRRLRAGRDEVRRPNEYRSFTRVLRANEAALARYQPGRYEGPVTFFAATGRSPEVYREFIRRTGCRLEIVPMPGGHLGMLEPPHVEILAAELLRRVEAWNGTEPAPQPSHRRER